MAKRCFFALFGILVQKDWRFRHPRKDGLERNWPCRFNEPTCPHCIGPQNEILTSLEAQAIIQLTLNRERLNLDPKISRSVTALDRIRCRYELTLIDNYPCRIKLPCSAREIDALQAGPSGEVLGITATQSLHSPRERNLTTLEKRGEYASALERTRICETNAVLLGDRVVPILCSIAIVVENPLTSISMRDHMMKTPAYSTLVRRAMISSPLACALVFLSPSARGQG
jgi:hypothetical protein